MARKLSGLKPNSSTTKTFSVKVDQTVLDRLKTLEERLARDAPDLSFDRSEVIENALEDAIDAANKELDKLAATKKGGAAQAPTA